jgi:hypothetical protein
MHFEDVACKTMFQHVHIQNSNRPTTTNHHTILFEAATHSLSTSTTSVYYHLCTAFINMSMTPVNNKNEGDDEQAPDYYSTQMLHPIWKPGWFSEMFRFGSWCLRGPVQCIIPHWQTYIPYVCHACKRGALTNNTDIRMYQMSRRQVLLSQTSSGRLAATQDVLLTRGTYERG